jgi:hypothetical protein
MLSKSRFKVWAQRGPPTLCCLPLKLAQLGVGAEQSSCKHFDPHANSSFFPTTTANPRDGMFAVLRLALHLARFLNSFASDTSLFLLLTFNF